METKILYAGDEKYCVHVNDENASFSVNIDVETMRELRDKMNYFLEQHEEKKRIDTIAEYVWNPRSERHEKVDEGGD